MNILEGHDAEKHSPLIIESAKEKTFQVQKKLLQFAIHSLANLQSLKADKDLNSNENLNGKQSA
jgi:hypothetical protein